MILPLLVTVYSGFLFFIFSGCCVRLKISPALCACAADWENIRKFPLRLCCLKNALYIPYHNLRIARDMKVSLYVIKISRLFHRILINLPIFYKIKFAAFIFASSPTLILY